MIPRLLDLDFTPTLCLPSRPIRESEATVVRDVPLLAHLHRRCLLFLLEKRTTMWIAAILQLISFNLQILALTAHHHIFLAAVHRQAICNCQLHSQGIRERRVATQLDKDFLNALQAIIFQVFMLAEEKALWAMLEGVVPIPFLEEVGGTLQWW